MMWLKLILGGMAAALGLSLLISGCLTPISPRCAWTFMGFALMLLLGLVLFLRGLREFALKLKR